MTCDLITCPQLVKTKAAVLLTAASLVFGLVRVDKPSRHQRLKSAGGLVLVQRLPEVNGGPIPEWWIVWVDGGVRNPRVLTKFHVADCDAGEVRWIKADAATRLDLSGLKEMSIQADCLVCDP